MVIFYRVILIIEAVYDHRLKDNKKCHNPNI